MRISHGTCEKIIAQEDEPAEHEGAGRSRTAAGAAKAMSLRLPRPPRIVEAGRSILSLFIVVSLHAAILAWLIHYRPQPPLSFELPKPLPMMTVALISLPEPQPSPAVTAPPSPPVEAVPAPPPKPKPKKAPVKKPAPRPKTIHLPVKAEAEPAPTPVTTAAIPRTAKGAPLGSPPAVPTTPKFSANYLRNPAPEYPAISRRLGEEGKVLLRVLVSPEGRAERVEINQSCGHDRLDQAAQDAVRRWQFIPARLGDNAVRAWVIVPIVFTLKG